MLKLILRMTFGLFIKEWVIFPPLFFLFHLMSTAAIFTLGAVGAAAVYANQRNSMPENENNRPSHLRRHSLTDHAWDPRLQPEFLWRRNHGVSFSHNSKPKFPTTHSDLGQTSK